MALFEPAVKITLEHEGGYVDNPADKGGPTNMGVTQKDMPGVDLKTLTIAQVEAYYSQRYWKPFFDDIRDQEALNKIFDMGVLFGTGTAARLAQAVLGVHQSEVFDEPTLLALNSRGTSFLEPYKARLVVHAKWIPTQDPTQEVFVNGWVNRISG